MINEFVPGRSYRYVGTPVSKDVLSDVPALSGAVVACQKAIGRCASFDCDISPELMTEYRYEEWEEVHTEARKEEGFYLLNTWVPAPKEHKEGGYKVYNCGAMGLSVKGAALQSKIGHILDQKVSDKKQGISGALLLEATEEALYDALKDGSINIHDLLAMTTLWMTEMMMTEMIVDSVSKREDSRISELAALLADALKEQ